MTYRCWLTLYKYMSVMFTCVLISFFTTYDALQISPTIVMVCSALACFLFISSAVRYRKRNCRVNLGGHCATEAVASVSDHWHFLNSADSPGRRRRRGSTALTARAGDVEGGCGAAARLARVHWARSSPEGPGNQALSVSQFSVTRWRK